MNFTFLFFLLRIILFCPAQSRGKLALDSLTPPRKIYIYARVHPIVNKVQRKAQQAPPNCLLAWLNSAPVSFIFQFIPLAYLSISNNLFFDNNILMRKSGLFLNLHLYLRPYLPLVSLTAKERCKSARETGSYFPLTSKLSCQVN